MPVWTVINVKRQPSVLLREWRVLELENGDRHLVGYCRENREGRVSSAIKEFDALQLRGVTRSGRVYQLVGRTGFNKDADYTWRMWADINEVTSWKDVSAELVCRDEGSAGP